MEEDYRKEREREREGWSELTGEGGGGTFGEAEMEEWGEVC
jgi:hypothetical protein